MKNWFFRLTAVHFVLTALTGLALYFRPHGTQKGSYSENIKEWLVMIHNGEWMSFLLFGNGFYSGIVVGAILSVVLIRFSVRSMAKPAHKST